jgi:ribose transport system permease protein
MEKGVRGSGESLSHGPSLFGSFRRGFPRLHAFITGRFFPIWVATMLLFVVSPLIAPGTLGLGALRTMAPFAAILAIAAVGQTLVVQQGGLDLSVPGTMSLAAALSTTVPHNASGRLPLALLVIALMAIAVGSIVGLAVARLGITPLVATLGVNALTVGTVVQVTGGSIASNVPANLASFAGGRIATVPTLAVVAVAIVVVVALIISRTVIGRRFSLLGANVRAARVSGIRVRRYQVGTYICASLCYAIGGVVLAGLSGAPSLNAGDSYLLPTIAAVVLGGTSLAGGRGSVVATAVGALFLTQLDQVVLATGAKNAVQSLIQAAIIALGMGLRNVPWRRLARRAGAGGAPETPAPAPTSATASFDKAVKPTGGARAALHEEIR